MVAVRRSVNEVVDEVEATGPERKNDKGNRRVAQDRPVGDLPGGDGRHEDEEVFHPLSGPHSADESAEHAHTAVSLSPDTQVVESETSTSQTRIWHIRAAPMLKSR